eukprot:8102016-Pyramimonas_sp.AAC.1
MLRRRRREASRVRIEPHRRYIGDAARSSDPIRSDPSWETWTEAGAAERTLPRTGTPCEML